MRTGRKHVPVAERNTNRLRVDPKTSRTLVEQARKYRKQPTAAEDLLWDRLRANQLGVRVRRQQPLGPFIADFFIPAARLVVEIDGPVHDTRDQRQRDAERQQRLEAAGLHVLRFRNDAILKDMEAVLVEIRAAVARLVAARREA